MVPRWGLAILLSSLLAMPAQGRSPALGAVIRSESASIRGIELAAGTTIFSGDTLDVGPRGSALILLGPGARLEVAGESRVRVTKEPSRVQVEVRRGAALFRSSAAAPVEGRLADATVRAVNGMPAVAVVAWRSATEAVIGAQKGQLLVTTAHDGKSVVLNEGDAIEAKRIGSDDEDGDDMRRGGLLLLGLIVAGGVTGLVLLLRSIDGEFPVDGVCNVLSPFRCP